MKKRLIITLTMMLVFAFAFAITAFAKDVDLGLTDTSGNPIVVPTIDDDGDALTWYRVTEEPTDGTYYTYVSGTTTYYVVSVKTKLAAVVNDDYYLGYSYSGISTNAWSGNILVMNLKGVTHADGTGPERLGFVFEGTAITYVYFPASITTLTGRSGNSDKQAFYAAGSIKEIEFEAGSKITQINTYSFYNCKNLKSIILPENLETIAYDAFNGLTIEIYVPKSVTAFEESRWANFTVNFTGTEQTVAGWAYQPAKINYLYHCDVYGYEHDVSGEPTCLAPLSCSRCGKILQEALGHEFNFANPNVVGVSYDNFDENGVKKIKCIRCDEIDTSVPADPIITPVGYSVKEDTTNGFGIAGGYRINDVALDYYKGFLKDGDEVSFGVLMFNATYYANEAIENLFVNGELQITEKAFQVKIEDNSYTTINFMISGFNDKSFATELAIAMYATEITTEAGQKTYETKFVQTTTNAATGNSVVVDTFTKGGVSLATINYYSVSGTTPEVQE